MNEKEMPWWVTRDLRGVCTFNFELSKLFNNIMALLINKAFGWAHCHKNTNPQTHTGADKGMCKISNSRFFEMVFLGCC